MKKLLAISFAVLFVLSSCFTGVFAAEKSETKEVEIKEAIVLEENGKYTLSITVQNLTKTAFSNVQCFVFSETEEIKFDENCAFMQDSSGTILYGGLLNSVAPLGTSTILLDLDTCTNPNAEVDLIVLYPYDGETVYGRSLFD